MINKGLVTALLIAVFGFIGFVIWQNYQIEQSSKVANQNSQVSPVSQATLSQEDMSAQNGGFIDDSSDEYFLIPELRIRFKKITGITPRYVYNETNQSVSFSTNEFNSFVLDNQKYLHCVTYFYPSVNVDLTPSKWRDISGFEAQKLADGRYLMIHWSPIGCAAKEETKSDQDFIENQVRLFEQFFDTVQSY